ncbi:hypothetical protein Tco_1478145 [Tanacetum coccineum]
MMWWGGRWRLSREGWCRLTAAGVDDEGGEAVEMRGEGAAEPRLWVPAGVVEMGLRDSDSGGGWWRCGEGFGGGDVGDSSGVVAV